MSLNTSSANRRKATASSPRSWLPLFSIYEDGVLTERGAGSDKAYAAAFEHKRSGDDAVISRLWDNPANKDVVDAFMNNKLCIEAAQGKPDAIEAYKKYVVQDYFYLVDWFKFRVLRLATLPHDDFDLDALSDELDSVHRALNRHVKGWFATCLTPEDEGGFGLQEEDFQVERTIGAVAYGQYLMNNSRSDNWYNLHIILIGCYWGWSKLALKLYNDQSTVKDTIFYDSWVAGNVDTTQGQPQMGSSARALSAFLDQNVHIWASQASDAQANELFRMVLRLEAGLFDSAYDDLIKRRTAAPKIPVGVPVPHRGGDGRTTKKGHEWRTLLGLESEGDRDNADGDSDRARKN